MHKEIFHPLQHTEMFKNGIVSIYCSTEEQSKELREYLNSIGYKWAYDNGNLFEDYNGCWNSGNRYYCQWIAKIGELLLCLDSCNCAKYTVYYKLKS
jgi:rhodanese-related sulfurtransferase